MFEVLLQIFIRNKNKPIMKKQILITAMSLITFSSIAQKESMLGNWTEQKRSFIDTTDAGRDLVNKEYDDYRSGKKKLDPKYITVEEFVAADSDKLRLVIWKEKDYFWAAAEGDLKNRILLEPKKGIYFLRYFGKTYEITYDLNRKILRLVNAEYPLDFYDFRSKG